MNWSAYHTATRTATYGFLSALPLWLLYEVMIVVVNHGRMARVHVGAEVWLKQLLAVIGGAGFMVLGGLVLVVGIGVVWYEWDRDIPMRGRYFAWMVGESAAYAVVVALLVSGVVGAIFAIAPQGGLAEIDLGTQLALSIGAGVYEELVFRVVLVGGLYLALRQVWSETWAAYPVAALVGAAIFSGVHYLGAYGDAFTLASFTFRFLFGLVLNGLFLARGFGIAAWTHALYDVMVVTQLL